FGGFRFLHDSVTIGSGRFDEDVIIKVRVREAEKRTRLAGEFKRGVAVRGVNLGKLNRLQESEVYSSINAWL
ncbi:hypothetical protein PJJ93_28990, partial [Mycobacterium kansasii]